MTQSRYDANPTTRTDGQAFDEQQDISGNKLVSLGTDIAGENRTDGVLFNSPRAIASTTGAWTNYSSAAKVGNAGINVKAAAGRIRDINVLVATGSINYYCLVVDKASAPVANDLPVDGFIVPIFNTVSASLWNGERDFGESGKTCTNGVSFAISTTPEKVTLPATLDWMVFVRYA